MFCPKCGKIIEITGQKYCQQCGEELPTIQGVPEPTYHHIGYQSSPKSKGKAGPYSKKCLAFAIGSLVVSNIGSISISLYSSAEAFSSFSSYNTPLTLTQALIISIVLSSIGLIMGVISRIFSKKADQFEPKNSILKAGIILGIIAIITSIIGLLTDPLMLSMNSYQPSI